MSDGIANARVAMATAGAAELKAAAWARRRLPRGSPPGRCRFALSYSLPASSLSLFPSLFPFSSPFSPSSILPPLPDSLSFVAPPPRSPAPALPELPQVLDPWPPLRRRCRIKQPAPLIRRHRQARGPFVILGDLNASLETSLLKRGLRKQEVLFFPHLDVCPKAHGLPLRPRPAVVTLA